jgi:hypothetical protein
MTLKSQISAIKIKIRIKYNLNVTTIITILIPLKQLVFLKRFCYNAQCIFLLYLVSFLIFLTSGRQLKKLKQIQSKIKGNEKRRI